MRLPDAILAKTLARFDSLTAEARNMMETAADVAAARHNNFVTGEYEQVREGYKQVNPEKFIEWRTKAATLLARVLPKGHVHRESADAFTTLPCSFENLRGAASLLRGIKDDLDKGFLDDLTMQIEAEIASDYMGQAEQLLAEGQGGKLDHVPAAVLAGAVLEKTLRALCSQQQPPISLKTPKGEFKTLGLLIDDLKKAGVFNEARAKQLRAWAALRNLAAHGEFAEFKRSDIEPMVTGINNFVGEYLK